MGPKEANITIRDHDSDTALREVSNATRMKQHKLHKKSGEGHQ